VIWIISIKLLKEETADIIILLIWGVIAASYIQTLFLNSRMVTMMGQQTQYNDLSAENIVNIFIWCVIIFIPLLVFIIFKIKKKTFRYEKIFILSLAIISGMQIAGLVSTAVSTDLPKGYEQEPVYFSYDAAVDFNSDENIVVFVLDTLDTRVTNYTFLLFPHLKNYLDGFTSYENNTAEYFDTVASVTSMLTRHHILPWEGGTEYIERAWNRHTFIDTLRENGFSSNLYLDRNCTFNRYELIKDRVDNLKIADGIDIYLRPFLSITARISLGRLSPYLLKNTWLSTITTDFSKHFFNIEVENDIAYFIPIVGLDSDMRFHDYIRQATFSADSDESVFVFMHMNSAHANGDIDDPSSHGYHFVEATGEIRRGGTRYDIVRANFETLNNYFNGMKEAGIYDNTTIIITGDHGLRERYPETTTLLIKPKDSTGEFSINNEPALSHLYFQSSILDAAGLPYEEYGVSYFDIIYRGIPAPPERVIFAKGLNSTTPNGRVYGDYGIWKIVGDANDVESWSFIPWDPLDFFP